MTKTDDTAQTRADVGSTHRDGRPHVVGSCFEAKIRRTVDHRRGPSGAADETEDGSEHTHTHTLGLGSAVALVVVLGIGVPVAASAASEHGHRHVVGNATGGGSVRGATPTPESRAERAHAQRKLRAALAYVAAVDVAAVDRVPRSGPEGSIGPDICQPQDPCPPQARVLAVSHAAQIKYYYCGPATGVMIMRYEGVGDSAYNGAPLDQEHVAGPDHMRTDIHNSTAWESDAFRVGINRWRSGTGTGFYVKLPSPSNGEFRAALGSDIDNQMPFGVSTLELYNSAHYNGHPNSTIGHWIVGQGYLDYRDTTSFDDPAANSSALSQSWDGVQPDFTAPTDHFNQTFVHSHGIVW